MKVFRYAFVGFIIGATVRAIMGSGQLFMHNRTKVQMRAEFASWHWVFLGAVVGTLIMVLMSVREDRKEKTRKDDE